LLLGASMVVAPCSAGACNALLCTGLGTLVEEEVGGEGESAGWAAFREESPAGVVGDLVVFCVFVVGDAVRVEGYGEGEDCARP
jgi:hypothetical protein